MCPASLTRLLLAVCVVSATATHASDYDYFLYVNQYARYARLSRDMTRCRWPGAWIGPRVPSYVSYFTIHGLWPNRNDSTWPQYCDSSDPFDVQQVADLLDELHRIWPDYKDPEGHSFWAHEWEKHGTYQSLHCLPSGVVILSSVTCSCSKGNPLVSDQHAYFDETLALRRQYDYASMLDAVGITPSASKAYSKQAIANAIYG